jgi:hypothetical protein
MPRDRALVVCLALVAALISTDVASAKEVPSTTCGGDRCRTVTDGISGIAVLAGRASVPRSGSFYTISLRIEINGKPAGWTVLYERDRQIVRGLDAHAIAFLGNGWARLTRDVRPHYARATRRLAPMSSAPGTATGTPSLGQAAGESQRNWILVAVSLVAVALLLSRAIIAPVKSFLVTIKGSNWEDLQEVELPDLPKEGDSIETRYGTCFVTSAEFEPDSGERAGKIVCRLP